MLVVLACCCQCYSQGTRVLRSETVLHACAWWLRCVQATLLLLCPTISPRYTSFFLWSVCNSALISQA